MRVALGQVGVRALVDDVAVVEHDDAIGKMQRRHAVRDQQGGSVGEHGTQVVVDRFLGPRVDRTRGVIEDEHGRIGKDRPGEGDPLALTAGQRESAFADDGVVAGWQRGDEVVRLGRASRGLDLRVARIRTAVGDVGADRLGEQEALLERDTDRVPQRVQRDVAYVVPVEQHSSRRRIVEARQQRGQRRLSAAARADDRDAFARRDVQRQLVQHGSVAEVETDVVEPDVATHVRQFDRVGRVGDLSAAGR